MQFLLLTILFFFLTGCDDQEKQATGPAQEITRQKGCQGCHQLSFDAVHNTCISCHQGDDQSDSADGAHAGLIAKPAHPLMMDESCGKCHHNQVKHAAGSIHFTLNNEVNAVRTAFGATHNIASLTDIPVQELPSTKLELADDLLRRRCLRCHVYYEGDSYSATERGTGCAACHLAYHEGVLVSHAFVALPKDEQCLQCHYGNYVGFDYHGRFEHDFKWEYRTPYPAEGEYPARPYGVEYHQLSPDIHQQRGLACIDCHPGEQLKGLSQTRTTCKTCHLVQSTKTFALPNLRRENNQLVLVSKHDNKKHTVPLLKHPAHDKYLDSVACQVCHAQWSYNDKGTHLLRQDMDDYAEWSYLSVQSSSEVELLLETSYVYDMLDILPEMTDKISGLSKPGIWYKGYDLRRWETPLIGRDSDGMLKIFRPVLDLHLSYVNEEEEVLFDSVKPTVPGNGLRPYTPHTTGKAGVFFKTRLQPNIPFPRTMTANDIP